MDTETVTFKNLSPYTIVPGDLEPVRAGSSGKCTRAMADSEHFAKLRSKGLIAFDGDVAPAPASTPTAPADWSKLHVNACTAWIRRCSDIGLMTELAANESREKVLAALESRVAELESSS